MKKTILIICIVTGILLIGITATSLSIYQANESKNSLDKKAGDETRYLLEAISVEDTPFIPLTREIDVCDENNVLVEPTNSVSNLAVNIYHKMPIGDYTIKAYARFGIKEQSWEGKVLVKKCVEEYPDCRTIV